ncbi:MAG: tRNA 4-thiouridine(8) synthase ThiI [Clostridiales bacterium]|nr:tRNA 4-thiouridine(8) synthase ThiI [Clostridiales bacterium]
MKEIILIKDGELALKGLNRSSFEDVLIKNIRRSISSLGEFKYYKAQSTITVEPVDETARLDEAAERISRVFGIAAFSRAAAVAKDIDEILRVAPEYLFDQLSAAATFKVEAKRSDKSFPLNSPQICERVGEAVLNAFPHIRVDVHKPDIAVSVEVRDNYAYIRGNQLRGAGGMPVGTSGRAALLISGGIDSPVAGYMMAKRGIELIGIHFASPPYTSLRSEEKVHSLLSRVARYSGKIPLFTVPFTEIQESIRDNCPEEYFTLIMRRFMMRISEKTAQNQGCGALVTGESVAQVASQTLPAIVCTDAVTNMPVFRPVIGMDKNEIITVSRQIDTFDISIQPFEDCCTVFTPKHPRTRPKIADVEKAEAALDIDALVERAIDAVDMRLIEAE